MRALIGLLAIIAVTGCATTKDWAATGGSRADGVVRLSFEVSEFERPQLSDSQAQALASQRCATWGYSGAEAFGGVTRQCNQFGGFGGCARWMVTKEFQCTGTGSAQQLATHPAPQSAVTTQLMPSTTVEPAVTNPLPNESSGQGYQAALRFAAERGCGGNVSVVSGNVYKATCTATGRSLVMQCQGPTCTQVN